MVFLIQNTQNRDSAALHLKLDELMEAEDTSERELDQLKASYRRIVESEGRFTAGERFS